MTNKIEKTGITKVCSRCKQKKDLTLFHRDKKGKDGRAWECKDCRRKREGRTKHQQNYIGEWRGMGFYKSAGYPTVRINGKEVRIHRIIAREKMGRKLKKTESVHHRDGNKSNFSKDNIVVLVRIDHCKLENKILWDTVWKYRRTGHEIMKCRICGKEKKYWKSDLVKKYKSLKHAKEIYRCISCRFK